MLSNGIRVIRTPERFDTDRIQDILNNAGYELNGSFNPVSHFVAAAHALPEVLAVNLFYRQEGREKGVVIESYFTDFSDADGYKRRIEVLGNLEELGDVFKRSPERVHWVKVAPPFESAQFGGLNFGEVVRLSHQNQPNEVPLGPSFYFTRRETP